MVNQIREFAALLLELGALVSTAVYAKEVYGLGDHTLLACNAMWFICAFLSEICAVVSYFILTFGQLSYVNLGNTFLRRHYSLAWGAGLGYFGLVSYTWYIYSGSYLSFLQLLVILVPLASRYIQGAPMIEMTQATTVVALISHGYISYLADNDYGMGTAVLMGTLAYAISIPAYLTREVLELSLAAGSFTIFKTLEAIHHNPTQLKSIPPIY